MPTDHHQGVNEKGKVIEIIVEKVAESMKIAL